MTDPIGSLPPFPRRTLEVLVGEDSVAAVARRSIELQGTGRDSSPEVGMTIKPEDAIDSIYTGVKTFVGGAGRQVLAKKHKANEQAVATVIKQCLTQMQDSEGNELTTEDILHFNLGLSSEVLEIELREGKGKVSFDIRKYLNDPETSEGKKALAEAYEQLRDAEITDYGRIDKSPQVPGNRAPQGVGPIDLDITITDSVKRIAKSAQATSTAIAEVLFPSSGSSNPSLGPLPKLKMTEQRSCRKQRAEALRQYKKQIKKQHHQADQDLKAIQEGIATSGVGTEAKYAAQKTAQESLDRCARLLGEIAKLQDYFGEPQEAGGGNENHLLTDKAASVVDLQIALAQQIWSIWSRGQQIILPEPIPVLTEQQKIELTEKLTQVLLENKVGSVWKKVLWLPKKLLGQAEDPAYKESCKKVAAGAVALLFAHEKDDSKGHRFVRHDYVRFCQQVGVPAMNQGLGDLTYKASLQPEDQELKVFAEGLQLDELQNAIRPPEAPAASSVPPAVGLGAVAPPAPLPPIQELIKGFHNL